MKNENPLLPFIKQNLISQISELTYMLESNGIIGIFKVSTKVETLRKQIEAIKKELGSEANVVLADVIEKVNEYNTKITSALYMK